MASNEDTSLDVFTALSRACNLFGRDLYKVIALKEKKNFVVSPFGLHSLLSLLSYGADKETLDELKKALYLTDENIHKGYKELIPYFNAAEDLEFKLSNAIYIKTGFPIIQQYLELGKNNFYTEISNMDFNNKDSVTEAINSWVRSETEDKFQSVLEPADFDEETRVILLNVIHFKGYWRYPFDESNTSMKDFHVSNSTVKKVPTMVKTGRYNIGSIPDLQTEFIEIPFENYEFVMMIFKTDNINGLPQFESKFNPDLLSTYESKTRTVNLHLPKFKFEVTIDMIEILEQLHMKKMFSDDADFSRMSDTMKCPLKVSKIFKKVYINVSEQGAEAAAVTTIMKMHPVCGRCSSVVHEFFIDRPFMFLIKHQLSHVPLFIGSIRDFE